MSNDESVLELSEDLGRIFSITRCLSDKTQCQLSKRLAGPIIPLSLWFVIIMVMVWCGLVWKRVSFIYGCDTKGVNNHLPVYHAIFAMVTKTQPNNRFILEQACSWPLRRQSFVTLSTTFFSIPLPRWTVLRAARANPGSRPKRQMGILKKYR